MTYNTLIIGSPKTGKTTQLIDRALDTMKAGDTVVFIDSHGPAADEVAHRTPPTLWDTTTLIDLSQKTPTPLAPLHRPHLIRDVLRDTAKYGNASTPVFDRLVFYAAASVSNILEMKYMLLNSTFRSYIQKDISDPIVKAFWMQEYNNWDDRRRDDRIQSTLNQLDVFLTEPVLRTTFCYPSATTHITGNTLIKIPRYKVGNETARVAGLMFLALLPENAHVFIDDAELLDGNILKTMLNDRHVTMTCTETIPYMLNSTGEKLVFRLGGKEAEIMDKTLGITGKVRTSTSELQTYDAYHITPNHRQLHITKQKPLRHKTFSQAPKAIRSNRVSVARKVVDAEIHTSVERHLCQS